MIRYGPSVAEAIARPDNNFGQIRLVLALAVVISHAFSVTTGSVDDEPLVASTRFTLGEHAVNGFFAISGFLVTMSFDRRGWWDYLVARVLRIAPGLIVAVLTTALVLGAFMTRLSLGDYLSHGGLWRFISVTLSSLKSTAVLPGVFEGNPFKFAMGTVWTLKYEVLCYAGILLIGVLGILRSRLAAVLIVTGLFLSAALVEHRYTEPPKGLETALRLPLIFAVGAALYVWRDLIRLSFAAAAVLMLATWLSAETALFKPMLFISTAYAVLWLALVPVMTRLVPEPRQDLSYGTYLYGWPVQQMLHDLFPTASPVSLLVPAILMTLLIAALSWSLVEKPALMLKARAVGRRTFRTVGPAVP